MNKLQKVQLELYTNAYTSSLVWKCRYDMRGKISACPQITLERAAFPSLSDHPALSLSLSVHPVAVVANALLRWRRGGWPGVDVVCLWQARAYVEFNRHKCAYLSFLFCLSLSLSLSIRRN